MNTCITSFFSNFLGVQDQIKDDNQHNKFSTVLSKIDFKAVFKWYW